METSKANEGESIHMDTDAIISVYSAVRDFGNMRFIPLAIIIGVVMFGFVIHCLFVLG